MKSPITNEFFTQSFSAINSTRIAMNITCDFGKVVYGYYEGAVREAKILSVHYINGVVKNSAIGIGVRAKFAGIDKNKVFTYYGLETDFYYTYEDCLNAYLTNNHQGCIQLKTLETRHVFEGLGLCHDYKFYYYYWNEEKGCPIREDVKINALWIDEFGWHVDYDKPNYKTYLSAEACKRDHMPKFVSFADENKPIEKPKTVNISIDINVVGDVDSLKEVVMEKLNLDNITKVDVHIQ